MDGRLQGCEFASSVFQDLSRCTIPHIAARAFLAQMHELGSVDGSDEAKVRGSWSVTFSGRGLDRDVYGKSLVCW